MWYFIFAAMFTAAGAALVYLTICCSRFAYVKKLGGDKKILRILLAAAPVIVFFIVCYFAFDTINTLIIFIHCLVISLVCNIVNYIMKKKRKKEFTRYYAGAASILISVVYLSAGWYLAHNVSRTAYEVDTDKDIGSLRVVQIADSHVGVTFDGEGFAGHMADIQNENPDIVVVTGDYVDDDTSKQDMIEACKALGSLKTTYGVYFVFGNHDKGYYASEYRGYNGENLLQELEKNGVHVLQDESVLIDNRFYIIGRQDRSEEMGGGSRLSMDALVENLDKEKYMIVLDHQPHDYEAQEASGVDLVLSGHTHGGQLFPINYVGEWTKENDKTYGIRKSGNTNFIVTSGISSWAMDFKTGCKSEYVVVDVKGNS